MRQPRAAWRIFITCWMIYALHFASNTVREIYPALSLGDHRSLRVDEYANLHPDLFETPGRGWHINSNPGASILAAIPYAVARPAIDRVVARVNAARSQAGAQPPEYDSPWPMAREFYQRAWSRGLDIKFGLAALVMQAGLMAPLSAAIVVLMFHVLLRLAIPQKTAVLLALLFAFGTPVFFRTGTLNHNLLLGHCIFAAFVVLWNPAQWLNWSGQRRLLTAGALAGAAILMDYSGSVLAAALGLYAMHRFGVIAGAWRFALGALGPLCVLWAAQWASFGHPFYPAQHWMPRVAFSDQGFNGVSLPALDLLWMNALDYRFGLFTAAPVLLLAFGAIWPGRSRLGRGEMAFLFGAVAALWLFSSAVQYARLQFNSGVRYMVPAVALLFIPAALVLVRLPATAQGLIAVVAITGNWCLAMVRDVERGLGLLDPVARVFAGGFELPFFTVLSRMGGAYGEYFRNGASPLPAFVLTAAAGYVIWRPYVRYRRTESEETVAQFQRIAEPVER